MRTILLEMLDMSNDKYEANVLENYLLWCNLNTIQDVDCQKLLANSSLFNWWYSQYERLEKKFIEDAYQYYGKADKGIMRQVYNDAMINIRHFYSKPLIKSAMRHLPITPQLN